MGHILVGGFEKIKICNASCASYRMKQPKSDEKNKSKYMAARLL
jgi:hypothetical protein